MQLAERSPTVYRALPDGVSHTLSGLNQSVYQRLKKSLSLNLRRQIFLAVCDDLALRNRLAAQLYAELAYPTQTPTLAGYSQSKTELGSRSFRSADPILTGTLAVEPSLSLLYPRLVSLNLNLNNPDPIAQILQWLEQYPPPRGFHQPPHPPAFQILGAERLTRQPACVQKQFLHALQQIEKFLPNLEFSLLLWLPRPWIHAVQQSAPAFWDWRTALFEFEGDPTPVPAGTSTSKTAGSTIASGSQPVFPSPFTEPASDRPSSKNSGQSSLAQPNQRKNSLKSSAQPKTSPPNGTKLEQTKPSSHTPETSSSRAKPFQQETTAGEDLWEILTQDLEQLKEERAVPSKSFEQQPNTGKKDENRPPQQLSGQELSETQQRVKSTVKPEVQRQQSVETQKAAVQKKEPFGTSRPLVSAPSQAIAQPIPPASPIALPYEPHSIQDLASLVMAIAMQEETESSASEHSDLIQPLERIQQLHVQQASSSELAAAYQSLGNLYRNHVEQGDDSESTLMIAICAYELALQWLDETSPLATDILNDIGNLYWMLSRGMGDMGKAQTYLERAIAVYQCGLSHIDPQVRSLNYSMIQNNLGSAFGDLARYHNPAEALENSVRAYEQALRYRKLEDDPARYAATQNNLGTAYWNLAQHHQPVLCLRRAIAAYTEALRYYSPEREPLYYAMIQNNLGTAYWNLAQHKQSAPDGMEVWEMGAAGMEGAGTRGDGDSGTPPHSPADWLHQAIAAYRAALTYRTMEIVPTAYAATQNNLGTAHWHLANLSGTPPNERREHLQEAIAAYQSALAAVNHLTTAGSEHPPALTFDPSATHNNLGLAYYQIATDKHQRDEEAKRSAYLEAALQHHLQALQGWQQNPDYHQTVFGYVLQTIRAFYSEFGMKGQNLALSKVPAHLLPEVMKRL
jgi:tetratricopeptide (TPR) repeat protein